MTGAVAAPAPEDDDGGQVVEHARCRCGRLAKVVLDADDDSCWCSVMCACGMFVPADAEGDRR